jgi:hypothetical protein
MDILKRLFKKNQVKTFLLATKIQIARTNKEVTIIKADREVDEEMVVAVEVAGEVNKLDLDEQMISLHQ